jgi:hypothetical protein
MAGSHAEHGVLGTAAGAALGMGIPLARRGAVNWALGPGQSGAIPKTVDALKELGPTKAKAAALAQALATLQQ